MLVTDQQAAELLCIGRTKVWALVKNGFLTPVMLPPRVTRFRLADIEGLVEILAHQARCTKSSSEVQPCP
ncbi:MAG: helix-turn-helix domain-containing protein, partial [Rhodoferax sp.]|nr:helix-turn-helix domain-containing protein [Rhodoferax sp.]